ncbi:facilitated trehalose transporter Tret1 [Drosophila albomicans]|uniref:Facilitated trehalose transporter Tret1 n=1 Tax=Drosophila albomicans TaxID=7291 RepID=A0A6P8ZGD5_DROAB|nr:facilitated trehalose transporter Tret1 [Drosophila albomicans]
MSSTGDVKFQYLAAIYVNIASISFGAYCGWPSASFLELAGEKSPLETGPLTQGDQGSVAAVLCLGGLIGNVFFVWLADRCGRKNSMLWVTLPSLLGWVLIPFARNPTHLIVARFLGGAAGGGVFGVIPIYIAELAEDSVRGILGTFLVLTCNIGIVLAFVLGYYFNYATVSWIVATLSVLFFVCFWFMPETPQYLMLKQKTEQAECALRYYRNIRSRQSKELSEELQLELHKLRAPEQKAEKAGEDEVDDNAVTWADFANPTARKAFLIGFGLVASNQGCGVFAMLNYTAIIFAQSGCSMEPTVAAIIVGVIQVVGSYVATLLVERAGRKMLLLISAVGICLSQLVMGAHSYLKSIEYDTAGFDWVPIVAFAFMLFIAACGLLTVPFLAIAEIMPPKIRSTANMLLMSVLWVLSMIAIKLIPLLMESLGMHGSLFLFASLTLCGTLFIAIFVPETKGKSIETILASL